MIISEIDSAIKEAIKNDDKYLCVIFDNQLSECTIIKNNEILNFYRKLICAGSIENVKIAFGVNTFEEIEEKIKNNEDTYYRVLLEFYLKDTKTGECFGTCTPPVRPQKLNEKSIKKIKNEVISVHKKVANDKEREVISITYEELKAYEELKNKK